MRAGLLLAAVVGLIAGSAAAAQDRAEREYAAIWVIAPSDQPLGQRSVRDGEAVFRNRLLPMGLARLAEDAVADDGDVLAPAGTQLFALMTRGAPIYCVVGRRDPSWLEQGLFGGGNRQICLVDSDRDRRFDGHFRAGNQVTGVPSFVGRRPRSLKPVSGGRFEEISPDQVAADYFVEVRYEGVVGLLVGPRPSFSIVYGTGQSTGRITQDVRPERGSEPPLVRVLGGEFLVAERLGDTIQVDVTRNVPAQPFHVVHSTTFIYVPG